MDEKNTYVDTWKVHSLTNVKQAYDGDIVMTWDCVACTSWSHLSIFHKAVLWGATDHNIYVKDMKQSVQKQQAAKKNLSVLSP